MTMTMFLHFRFCFRVDCDSSSIHALRSTYFALETPCDCTCLPGALGRRSGQLSSAQTSADSSLTRVAHYDPRLLRCFITSHLYFSAAVSAFGSRIGRDAAICEMRQVSDVGVDCIRGWDGDGHSVSPSSQAAKNGRLVP